MIEFSCTLKCRRNIRIVGTAAPAEALLLSTKSSAGVLKAPCLSKSYMDGRMPVLRCITDWVFRRQIKDASDRLAKDFGIPERVTRLLMRSTIVELAKCDDPMKILRAAAAKMKQDTTRPDAYFEQLLESLEEPHRSNLIRYRVDGIPPFEIAKRTGLTVGEVEESLANSYAELRMKMTSAG